MTTVQVVIWDNIGNVLWGMEHEKSFGANWRDKLLPDDAAAIDRFPTMDELFAGYAMQLHRCHTLAEVEAAIPEADFVVIHKEVLPGPVLEKGTKVRLLQHLGLDYRGVPMETARAMGIPVAATPLVNYLVVAEHGWAMILNWVKNLPYQRDYMDRRGYQQAWWGAVPSMRIGVAADLTLGLVGFGEIARPMANYARAFGMKTLYWDRVRFPDLEERYAVEYAGWEDLFRRSDVVTVQLPITPETHKIIGAREIGWMKPTALFVNTARGKLVDEPALIAALQERRLGGAALDVFYDEPLPADSPLFDLARDLSYRVTLTSHSAWQGHWTHVRDSLGIWDNVLAVLRGEPIRYQVG